MKRVAETKSLEYAKRFAAESSCTTIRIDTYARNDPAMRLHLNNGFRIGRYGRILPQVPLAFNGAELPVPYIDVMQVHIDALVDLIMQG